jgi:hypothetical protein
MYAERAATGQASQSEEADLALWSQFAAAEDVAAFCAAWLSLQCLAIQSKAGSVRAAVVLWRQDDDSFAPAGVWPSPRHDVSHLATAARQSLAEGRGLCLRAEGDAANPAVQACIAYPVMHSGSACGVAVLDLQCASEPALQRAMRQLHWGAGWLENKAAQQGALRTDARFHQAT